MPRWTTRTVRRHPIVVARNRGLMIECADGYRRPCVARGGRTRIANFTGVRIGSVVASRDDNEQTFSRRGLDGKYQRIGCRRLEDGMTQRKIDDVDAKPI